MGTLSRPRVVVSVLLLPALLGCIRSAAAAPAEPSGEAEGARAPIDTAAHFDHLQSLIKPPPAEQTGESVPWRASLWDARRAAAEGKLIVPGKLDGHALGCV